MDILTEIYRIKQVMGLITEQSSGNLVTDDVYEAIKNIESVFSKTDKNGEIIGIAYNPRGKESNIKKAIQETIGLDDWGKMDSNLKGQIYSFMFQSDSGPMTRLRWLAGLAQAIDPKINRTNIVDKPITDSNVQSAIKLIKDNINSINYNKYMTVVKDQYKNIYGTINDDANKLKIWGPRPEALDKLMSGESWPDVKAWWYNEIGETEPITQANNASTQKDSTSANPNAVQPPINQQQDSIPTNTAQPNTAAPAITTSQATVQSSEDLDIDTIRDGEHGDPYVYIRNKAGDFLTFKCGKKDENCPYLRTKPNTVKWINVSQKVRDGAGEKYVTAETAIKTSIYKEGSITPAEEEEATPENDINLKIKKAFRNEYYKYLIEVIKRKLTENNQGYTKVARTPCFYNNTSGCGKDYTFVFRNTNNNKKYFKIFLDSAKTSVNDKPQTDISDASLNEAMNKLVSVTNSLSGGIKISGDTYKIRKSQASKIMKLSDVFDADNTPPKHIKNEKVQNLNASKTYYIYKV